MKYSNAMVSASFDVDHHAMRTLHAVIDTGAGPNVTRSGVLPICWQQDMYTSASLLLTGDANGRTLKLHGVAIIQLRLGIRHIQVPFIIIKHLDMSMII